MLLLRLEQAVIEDESENLAAHADDLELLRDDAEELVRDSEANAVVPPVDLLHRYGRLGQVLVELARTTEALDSRSAASTAVMARAFLLPLHELHVLDADEEPNVTIRYADACRIASDLSAAERTLSRGLRRLEARCGPDYGPCVRMRARLIHVSELLAGR
jgi:hypothetical protein